MPVFLNARYPGPERRSGLNWPFKERYATERYSLVRLRATRPTFCSLVSVATVYVPRRTRKVFRLVRQTIPVSFQHGG
jgi:hypothetical protein